MTDFSLEARPTLTEDELRLALDGLMIAIVALGEQLAHQFPLEDGTGASIDKLGQMYLGQIFEPKPLDHRGPGA